MVYRTITQVTSLVVLLTAKLESIKETNHEEDKALDLGLEGEASSVFRCGRYIHVQEWKLFSVYTETCSFCNCWVPNFSFCKTLTITLKRENVYIVNDSCFASSKMDLSTLYFVNILKHLTVLMPNQAVVYFLGGPSQNHETHAFLWVLVGFHNLRKLFVTRGNMYRQFCFLFCICLAFECLILISNRLLVLCVYVTKTLFKKKW